MNSTYSEGPRKTPQQIIPVEILGVSFTIRTDEDPAYIQALIAELKERLSSVSSQMRIVDPLKLALITNLLTLDEMRHNDDKKAASTQEFEAASLLASLDKRLGELGF